MRIAYMADSLPPTTDGVSKTFCHLFDTLRARDIEFIALSPFQPDSSIAWHDRVIKIRSFAFPLYNVYRIALPYFCAAKERLDAFRPDIVHASSPTLLGLFGCSYARRKGIPVVASYHTHFTSYFKYYRFARLEWLGWRILKRFHNRFDATFAPSLSTARELVDQAINDVEIWGRGVDLTKFSPGYRSHELRRRIGVFDDNTPILLFVGRLVKEKDLDDLVAAHQILESWGKRFQLVIIGGGPMEQKLENRLPEAHFTGMLHGRQLSQWYASADLFVFPSTTETFGNVIQEAYASGIPAIGVDKGGVPDLIVDGGTGFIARSNDPLDLAHKTAALIDDAALRQAMGRRGFDWVGARSWDEVNGSLIASYERLISNGSSKPEWRGSDRSGTMGNTKVSTANVSRCS